MKLCFSCGRVTAGAPSYCHNCGKTYNVKLCSRGHINPRSANVCSQCGSREMSTPQRKIPILLKPLIFLLSHLVGIILIFSLVAFVGYFAYQIIVDPNGLLPLQFLVIEVASRTPKLRGRDVETIIELFSRAKDNQFRCIAVHIVGVFNLKLFFLVNGMGLKVKLNKALFLEVINKPVVYPYILKEIMA